MGDDDEESDGVEDEEWEEADGVSLGMGLDGMDQDPMGFRHGAFAVDDDGEAPDVEGADDDEPLDGEGEDAERRAADHLAGRLQGIIAEARRRGGEEPVVELRMGGRETNSINVRALVSRHGGSAILRGAARSTAEARDTGARADGDAARDLGRGGILSDIFALRRSLDDARRDAAAARATTRARAGGKTPGETPAPPRSSPTRRGDPAPTPPSPGPPRTPCCSARGSATRVSPRGPRTPPPRTRPRPAPAPAVRRPRCPPAAPIDRGAARRRRRFSLFWRASPARCPAWRWRRRRRLPRRRRGARRAARAHGLRVRGPAGGGVARVPAPHRARVRPSQRRARPTTRGLPGRDGASRLVRLRRARRDVAGRRRARAERGVPRALCAFSRSHARGGSGDCALEAAERRERGGTRGENQK